MSEKATTFNISNIISLNDLKTQNSKLIVEKNTNSGILSSENKKVILICNILIIREFI